MMKTLSVEFITAIPDGPRIITERGVTDRCLVCSRTQFGRLPYHGPFDVAGVYVLVGSDQSRPKIYIGQGDSVQERLQAHLKHKDFWHTAFVFFSEPEPLHAGNYRYLESSLCEAAWRARMVCLDNQVIPKRPPLSTSEESYSEALFERAKFYLAAFGCDFFSPPDSLPETPGQTLPEAPRGLEPVLEELRRQFERHSDVRWYSTETPDYRAKISTDDETFRVIARIRINKGHLRVSLKDAGEPFNVVSIDDVRRHEKEFEEAYRAGRTWLGLDDR